MPIGVAEIKQLGTKTSTKARDRTLPPVVNSPRVLGDVQRSPNELQSTDMPTKFPMLSGDDNCFVTVWRWLEETHGTEYIDGYYLNGGGNQGLVMAARVDAGLAPCPPGIVPNSEGDTCYIHFPDLRTAVETATLAQQMILDRATMAKMVVIAREQDLDD